ncbi:hypothetical protein COCHEDRAFT_1157513 [Bipolaris maydis C5]|uniref:protein-tyrosine-phosphatase n=1 Tax=Cochliobolus heterostrophus (strain C5 / ATCC 48332 / race O) TaxID=701091 RepID=M2U9U0_COCH5|nr:hypothetical protein COCHEDRAFT_1157513 [Bipolaris maydis C5]KAJ6206409.1 hypothetical protein PSV09DRAFT_1157513 [Bipolaris maydis]
MGFREQRRMGGLGSVFVGGPEKKKARCGRGQRTLGAGRLSGFRNQRDAGETSSRAHMTQRQMTRCAAGLSLSPRQQVGRRLSHVAWGRVPGGDGGRCRPSWAGWPGVRQRPAVRPANGSPLEAQGRWLRARGQGEERGQRPAPVPVPVGVNKFAPPKLLGGRGGSGSATTGFHRPLPSWSPHAAQVSASEPVARPLCLCVAAYDSSPSRKHHPRPPRRPVPAPPVDFFCLSAPLSLRHRRIAGPVAPSLRRLVEDLVFSLPFTTATATTAVAAGYQSLATCSKVPSILPSAPRWPRRACCPPPTTQTTLPRSTMVQTSSRSFMPMPSFGAVFGGEHHNKGHADGNGVNLVRPATSPTTSSSAPFSSFHIHTESRESNSTTSSDNSPTTTISTMDSSSVTDPSPGVSPESPLGRTLAPSSCVADFRSRRTEQPPGDSSTFFELQRPTTPAKKPRNLKNLGINTASSLSNLRAHTPAPVAVAPKEKNSSAPPSPLFIKPPTPPKRRPSNLSLTISTPGSTDNKPVRLLIPSTPSFNRPPLRHFQSSPSLPLCSPSVNPFGGMQLPPRPVVNKPTGLAEVPFEMEEEEDQEPNFDVPQSREEKPAAYPNGPICIYEAGVYLYFEPTAVQATTFDVIINVASEVKNPFTAPSGELQKDIDARRVDGPPAENIDFATLSQRPKQSFGMGDSSPTTPKATAPVMQTIQPREVVIEGKTYKTPEYIHMPWEHNTDIVPDLHKLVKMIDERVQQGKRVLIHCQCGVSRSASLIVAYGLYKDPQMSVQEAYDKAKKRSKWIGPNMNLIMQLQEFRNSLLRQNESRSYHNQGYGRRSAGLPSGSNKYSSYDRDGGSGSRTPRTAPLPPDSDMTMQRASTGNMIAISPGPLSAPTGAFSPGFRRSWDSSPLHFELTSQPAQATTPYVDPKGQVVPMVSVTSNDVPTIHTEDISSGEATPQSPDNVQPPSFPNFSRQLRLRPNLGIDEGASSRTEERLLAPMQPSSFEPLRSPAVASFNIPTFPSYDTADSGIMSPIKTSFDNSWPAGYDLDNEEPDSAPQVMDGVTPGISPRSSKLDMSKAMQDDANESYGTSFHLGQPAPSRGRYDNDDTKSAEIASPVKTQFSDDIFASTDDRLEEDLKSPRATEFHMTPLKPRLGDEDPFGLTSPTRADFNPFDRPSSIATIKALESEDRRPSFQAILPPAHQTFNGFASLDGTAQTNPIFESPVPLNMSASKQFQLAGPRVDSHSNSPAKQVLNRGGAHTTAPFALPKAPATPRTPTETFLSTPGKAIRTRFSSPNMNEQRKLQKLQTEIQSKLPRAAVPRHAADDIDALMSPRAEEFTRNPFRFELQSPGEDASPVSSNGTIKDGRNGHTAWEDPMPRHWTPEKATADPRSPVQTGVSPIVRNIWDVL